MSNCLFVFFNSYSSVANQLLFAYNLPESLGKLTVGFESFKIVFNVVHFLSHSADGGVIIVVAHFLLTEQDFALVLVSNPRRASPICPDTWASILPFVVLDG